jgi:hypothetical protein
MSTAKKEIEQNDFYQFILKRIDEYERGAVRDKAVGDIKNQEIMERCADVLKYQVKKYERELETTAMLKQREVKKQTKHHRPSNVVNLAKLRKAVRYIKRVNNIPLEEAIIELKTKKVKLPSKTIEEWSYIGLSNKDLYLQIKDDGSITKKVTCICPDVKQPKRYLDKLPPSPVKFCNDFTVFGGLSTEAGLAILEAVNAVTTEYLSIVDYNDLFYVVPSETTTPPSKRTAWESLVCKIDSDVR